MRRWWTGSGIGLLLGLAAGGCTGTDGETDTGKTDSDADADADTDTDADSDSDADTDTDTDADADLGTGELVKVGDAVVDGGYLGTETMELTGRRGDGDLVCQIRYTLTSIGERVDCPTCSWAYDVQISGAAVLVDTDGACASGLGLDASTVGSLDGTVVGYGYNPDYFGHAEVLMTDLTGSWAVGSYATYDTETGVFRYDWVIGEQAY